MSGNGTHAVKPPCGRNLTATIHGVISMICLGTAFAPALAILFRHTARAGIVEIVLLGIAAATAVSVFCTKCSCRASCAHVLPGLVANILPNRKGPYTVTELGAVMVMFALPALFPQVWLVGNMAFFAAFWILLAAGAIEIVVYVCARCGNGFCPVHRIRHQSANTS